MLKIECDICHEINDPADSYGETPAKNTFNWQAPVTHYELNVYVGNIRHMCGSCLGDHLLKMVVEIWPEKVKKVKLKKVKDAEDDPDGDRADSDMSEVRAEPELQEPSTGFIPNIFLLPAGEKTSGCTCLNEGSGFDPNCPVHRRRVRDSPQA